MTDDSEWDAYFEASSLSSATAAEFGERIRSYEALDPSPQPFVQAEAGRSLKLRRDSLQKRFRSRKSTREFTSRKLDEKDLALIFSAFARHDSHRSYPSAGGLYPVSIFGLVLHGPTSFDRYSVRYEPSDHSLARMRKFEDVTQVETVCSLEPDIHPQLVVIFAADMYEVERKYGQRAGRFVLLEAGHAAQNLALRISGSKLVGYEIGGVQEGAVKEILGLSDTRAKILHGYAVGK